MNPDRGPGVVEAARYIEAFRNRIVVVKLGGELLDGGPVLDRILPQVAVLYRCGLRPLLVHGGGKQVDAASAERGIVPVKHHGRRVTTPEVLQLIVDVVAGTLNQQIVARLRELGVPAVGFADGVSAAVQCTRRPPSVIQGESVDWGAVGDIAAVDASRFEQADLTAHDWAIPVLPSVGTLSDGSYVNVNADAVAANVASALDAIKLVLLTGVAGVMERPDSAGPISELNASEARTLIVDGIVSGGMCAKLEEALKSIAAGVPRVHIISGREPATLLREIFTDEGCGTLILPDDAAPTETR